MAPKKRRIGIPDLFRFRTIVGADISPDGEKIAYAVKRLDYAKNANYTSLYLVPAKGGRIRRLTRGDVNDHSPRFSPDGSTLAFLSDRDKGSAVWLLPMDGGEPKRLTDRDGAILDYAWSPDGKHLAVARRALTEREKLARDEKRDELKKLPHFRHVTKLAYKMDGAGYLSGERAKIHLVKVSTGKSKPLTTGDFDDMEPRFSPDGTRVSFISNRTPEIELYRENTDIYTVGLDGTGQRKITREGGPAFCHTWSPDGRVIYYLGNLGGPCSWSRHNVHLRRVAAGGGKSKDLTPGLDRDATNTVIGDLTGLVDGPPPMVTPDGAQVLFCWSDHGACHLGAVPAEGGPIREIVAGAVNVQGFGLPRGGGDGWILAADLGGTGDLHRLPGDLGSGEPKRLTKVNEKAMKGLDLVEPEEVRFRRRGGHVHGWLLKPVGFRAGRKYPVVLNVHGGPHVGYGHTFFFEMQLLAATGYVVLMLNPRGSDGYGLDHRASILGDYGTLDAKDLLTGLDAVLREGYVDPKRQYVTGGSYGGYMTNWLLGTTKRFRAAVTQRSVTNFHSFFGSSDIGYLFPKSELGGHPWEVPEVFERCNPITNVKKIETPLLIIHSEEDYRCPIEQGEQLFAALKVLGREVEMVRFVGESHGLSRGGRPKNREERLRRILDWFARHGGPKPR